MEIDLSISRFGGIPKHDDTITFQRVHEHKLLQNMLKELRFVLNFDPGVLERQRYYWLSFITIIDENVRTRLKGAIEKFCHTPVTWLSHNEIEININPNERVFAIKGEL